MNKDQIKGTVTDLKGQVQETAGKVLGNDKLKAKGQDNQILGKAEQAVGNATESVKQVVDAAHIAGKKNR